MARRPFASSEFSFLTENNNEKDNKNYAIYKWSEYNSSTNTDNTHNNKNNNNRSFGRLSSS